MKRPGPFITRGVARRRPGSGIGPKRLRELEGGPLALRRRQVDNFHKAGAAMYWHHGQGRIY